jgi:hypothetical protein
VRPKLHPGPYRAFIDDLLSGKVKAEKLKDTGGGPWTYDDPTEDDVVALGGLYISLNGTDPGLPVVAGGLGYGTWARVAQGRLLLGVDENTAGQNAANLTLGAASTTPTGTVSAPTFTGSSVASQSLSAGTPAGTIAAHATTTDSNTTGGTNKVTGSTHTFVGSALAAHAHNVTAAGTVSAPTFTGTPMPLIPPSLTVYMWTRTA